MKKHVVRVETEGQTRKPRDMTKVQTPGLTVSV